MEINAGIIIIIYFTKLPLEGVLHSMRGMTRNC